MSTLTAFTSGKRAELGLTPANHDPKPFYVYGVNGYSIGRVAEAGKRTIYAPRPEFDVPDNPILVEFRFEVDAGYPTAKLARMWIDDYTLLNDVEDIPGVNSHARRVLSKLAVFA